MTTYNDDWVGLSGTLSAALPLVRRFREFWTAPSSAESEYFVVLGHAARNALGATAAKNAVRVAVERLKTTGLENARAAIDIEVGRCLEAAAELGKDRESASAWIDLIAGRESLEGLRMLLRLAQFENVSNADGEQVFAELLPLIDGGAAEVDGTVEGLGLANRRSTTPLLFTGGQKHFRSIAESHPDDWWNALLQSRSRRELLQAAAVPFKDEFAELVKWVPALRNRRWRDARDVERLTKDLEQWIDASYTPRHPKQKQASRALRILWDASGDLLRQLAQRTTRGEIVRWMAQAVTLTLTLYDRVLGLVEAAARVPSDLQRLGWAAHAWRMARLLQYRDGELVVNAFRRHSMWQSTQSGLKHPDAVAAGCVAASWYVAQTGYLDEAKVWLQRAETLVRDGKRKDSAQRLVTIADGCTELAALYLQDPEQPDISFDLCSHAIALTDECSAEASQSERCVAARIHAMVVRAAASDQKGEFLLALDERNAALRQLETAPALSTFALMEMRRGLYLACGDVDSAEQVMLAYIQSSTPGSAAVVAFSRSTMLLDYGYTEAGIKGLQDLASQKRPARWSSRARALLGNMRSLNDAGSPRGRKPDLWTLEVNAQAAFLQARRLAGMPTEGTRIAAALRENDKLLRQSPTDLIGLTRKSQLLIQRGTDADLKRANETLDRLDQEDPYVLFCRGHLAFKRRDFVGAASWLREAYEIAPRSQTALLLAQSLTRSHQLSAALEVVNAQDSVEDDAPLLDTRGIILAGLGQHADAWSSFEQALGASRALRASLPTEGPPRRTRLLCQRMASLAPHVARKQPSAIERFLRRDADAANTFISSCVSRLAFDPSLRQVILSAGRNPMLQRAVAQYAMGACVYEDTMGHPEEVPRILEALWTTLELRHNRSLIAELLAGGKSAYLPSIRSALEGAATVTRRNATRWLVVQPSRWADITQHVATTLSSATYYRDTGQLVDKHPELWSSMDALIDHVQQQIPTVRFANLEQWNLTSVLPQLNVHDDEPAYLEALVESARRIGPDRAIVSTGDLNLHAVPPFLVDVTPWTVRLAVRVVGTPTDYEVLRNDESAFGVRVMFDGAEWPTSLRDLLETEGLIPAKDQRSLVLPIEATDLASIDRN